MSILKLTNENFEQEVLENEGTVLVDFYADWCGPCRMMAPILDSIAKEVEGKAKVGKVNIDDNQDIAMQYQIMSIPTMIIFKNGEVHKTFIGVQDKSEIIKSLE